MKIDFVSDVTCPWCAIGLASLEQSIALLGDAVQIDLRMQPFELNPDMAAEGEDLASYLQRKYGVTADELAGRQEAIRQRAAEAGLRFGARARVWNTFDAHRLLHWAGLEGRQRELKRALLSAYHERGENPGSHGVLLRAAAEAGLGAARARAVLEGGEFADESARGDPPLAVARHPRGAVGYRRRSPPDPGRPAGRGVRERIARDRGRARAGLADAHCQRIREGKW